MKDMKSRIFRFDNVEIDVQNLRVTVGSEIRPLEPKSFRLLQLLVENSGRVLTKEEIMAVVWPDAVVSDNSLARAITQIRKALDDDPKAPRYIETVPSVGYRFVGNCNEEGEQKPISLVSQQAQEEAARKPSDGSKTSNFDLVSRTSALIGLAILIGASLFVVLRISRSRPPASSAAPETTRFRVAIPQGMRLPGAQTFSLSPDGRTLVYLAQAADGVSLLWVQSLNSLEPRVLAGTKGSCCGPVFWSPDSKFVAFNTSDQMLKKIDVSGDPPQEICAAPSIVLGGSWNREGTLIFGTETSGVMRLEANSGNAVPFITRDTARDERAVGWPTFLPDGRHFLYSRLSSVAENSGVFVASLDAKPGEQSLKRLVETPFASQFVASPDGNGTVLFQRETTLWAQSFDTSRLELTGEPERVAEHDGSFRAFGFFASSSTGALVHRSAPVHIGQLTWFDRRGRRLASVGQPSNESPQISPDGTRFAVSKFEGDNVDVWVRDLARDVSQRITFDPAIDEAPIWSPDGKRIAFSSSRAGHYDLYQIGAGGEGREDLLYSSNENKFATSWSADGRFLLYGTEPGSADQGIWVLPMKGTGKHTPFPLIHTRANERAGVLSPDSRWIAYVSNESGTAEVYLQPFSLPPAISDGGPKVLLSRGGGMAPHWRADGKEIFYQALNGTLMSVAVTTVGALRPGVPLSLFHLAGKWDAAGAGDRFLVSVPVEPDVPPFTVVLNWQEESKK